MTPEQLSQRIQHLAPETTVDVIDLTGTQDHYQAIIVSPAFEGKLMIEQHRMVFALVKDEVDSGELHALTLKTFSPQQYQTYLSRG
jgi:stress-induced morphogen